MAHKSSNYSKLGIILMLLLEGLVIWLPRLPIFASGKWIFSKVLRILANTTRSQVLGAVKHCAMNNLK